MRLPVGISTLSLNGLPVERVKGWLKANLFTQYRAG